MSTKISSDSVLPSDWISQAEAAVLRGISRQAIGNLVRRGRIRVLKIGGKKLVNREDVAAFMPRLAGRPKRGPEK